MLKVVARLNPSLLSMPFVNQAQRYDPNCSETWREATASDASDYAEGTLEEESDSMTGNFWAQLDSNNAISETCFWIDVNIDGIQLFKSSQRPQVSYFFLL